MTIDQFWKKIRKTDTCWLWTGHLLDGYGRVHHNGRRMGAHAWAYMTFKGPLKPGLVIHHECDQRNCVNPDHLEQITQSENIRRGDMGQFRLQMKKIFPIADEI